MEQDIRMMNHTCVLVVLVVMVLVMRTVNLNVNYHSIDHIDGSQHFRNQLDTQVDNAPAALGMMGLILLVARDIGFALVRNVAIAESGVVAVLAKRNN